MPRSIQEIDKEIADLQDKYNNVQGTKCEVYARVVGYYREVKNWNRGKAEEYKHRITYKQLEEK